jgi:ATP-binding cassette subfamily B protein
MMKKKLEVIQEEISDCGVCSLLSIIRYYNGNASLESLRIDSLTTKEGVNAYNLVECAKKQGFDAKCIKELDLNKIIFPCIAHIKINESLHHFIVLYELNNNILKVMDPAIGFKISSIKEFNSISTNIYIELVPKQSLCNFKIKHTAEEKLFKVMNIYKHSLLKVVILNIIFIILTLISSTYIKVLNNINILPYAIIIYILINILSNYVTYYINKKINTLDNNINKSLLSEFFSHVFRLPLKYIHMKDKNEIIKRVEEIEVIDNLMLNVIISSILSIMIILSITIIQTILFKYNIILIIILILFQFIYNFLSTKKIKYLINESITNSTDYKSTLINDVNSMNSIYHSNSITNMLNILNEKKDNYLNINLKNNIYTSKIKTIKNSISSTFILLSNLIMLYFVASNNLSMVNLIIIYYLNNILVTEIENMTNLIPSYYYYKSVSNKLNEFYNIDEIKYNNNILNIDKYDIRINNINFKYNNFNIPIKNFSTIIESGDKVLLSGTNGCGKSTLLKILSGEYNDYHGNISIGGINLKDISFNNLNNILYYSSQNESIFIDTIKNNITMHKSINEEYLDKVIKITNLDILLKKKSFGINTFLYGGGEELSGGERQLIIVTRALLSNTPIIILDESLSEVEESIEESIINNIINNYPEKTLIYVSHKQNKKYPLKIINMEERRNNGTT